MDAGMHLLIPILFLVSYLCAVSFSSCWSYNEKFGLMWPCILNNITGCFTVGTLWFMFEDETERRWQQQKNGINFINGITCHWFASAPMLRFRKYSVTHSSSSLLIIWMAHKNIEPNGGCDEREKQVGFKTNERSSRNSNSLRTKTNIPTSDIKKRISTYF